MVLFTTNTLKALTEHKEITYFEIRQRTVPLSYKLILYDFLYQFFLIMLVRHLVIRNQPVLLMTAIVRTLAHFDIPPLFPSAWHLLHSFYPVMFFQLSSAQRTDRILVALYPKKSLFLLLSTFQSDMMIMVEKPWSRRQSLCERESLRDFPFFSLRMTSYQLIL